MTRVEEWVRREKRRKGKWEVFMKRRVSELAPNGLPRFPQAKRDRMAFHT